MLLNSMRSCNGVCACLMTQAKGMFPDLGLGHVK